MIQNISSVHNCPFCAEFHGWTDGNLFAEYSGGPSPSRILCSSDELVVVPSLGPLVLGHLLVCTRRHFLSFGEAVAHRQAASKIELCVEEVTRWLFRNTGFPVIVFEHGSALGGNPSGACNEHAHLHLVPIPNSVGDWLQLAENGWSRLKSYEELGEWAKLRTSYLYYEDVEGRRWGRTAWPGVPSQYFRQELAAALGFPERGDWRASRDIEPLERMLAINHADPLII